MSINFQSIYFFKLSVVISALDCDPNNQDLIELKTKLIDIIALTESMGESVFHKMLEILIVSDDLVDVKKVNLLSMIGTNEDPKPSTSSMATDNDKSRSESDVCSLVETLEELNGKECRVAFTQQNGIVGYHNGIVMTSELMDAIEQNPDLSCIKVKVFFTHPMNNSMLPCPHYLSSKCRYSAEKCKYSHGYEVSLEDIKPFQPKDYSRVGRDLVCLAKNESDGLWHKAVVDDIRDQRIVVKYCDSDFIDSVDIEDILPLSESDSTVETTCDNSLNNSFNDESDELSVIDWNSSSSEAMAKWEVHTKGIGSKLMAKMGYVWGQGLGRKGEGMTNPIDVFVFPTGKSLDACIALRQKYLTNDELRQKIRNKEKKLEERIADGYHKLAAKDNVFDFINTKILAKKETSKAEAKDNRISVSQLKASNTKSLNISSVKISEDIRKAEFDLKRLNDSLARNKSKDKAVTNNLTQKIDKQKQLISSLKNKESMIQREQKSRSDKQKLTVF